MNSRAVQEPKAWFACNGGYFGDTQDTDGGLVITFRAHTGSSGYLLKNTNHLPLFSLGIEESEGTAELTATCCEVTHTYSVTLDEWHTVIWAPVNNIFKIDGADQGFSGSVQNINAVQLRFCSGATDIDIATISKWDTYTDDEAAYNRNFVPQSKGSLYLDTVNIDTFFIFGPAPDYYTPETDPWGGDPDPGPDTGDTGTTGWLTFSQSAGTGTTQITLTAPDYRETQVRTASLRIEGENGSVVYLTAVQEAFEPLIELNPASLSFSQTGGTQTLSVSSNVEWTAEAPVWVELSASSGTSGETQITVSTENHTGDTALNGSIVFKYNNSVVATVSVSQGMTEAYLWIINNDTADTQIKFTNTTSQANIEYSDDSINWNSDSIITPGQGKYIRGDISASANANVSLLLNPNNNCTIGGSLSAVSVNYPGSNRYYKSFFRGSTVTDCQALLLDTNVPDYVPNSFVGFYSYFLEDCINLIIPPEFPPLELKKRCFMSMFAGCTSLTTAPELPYTTLADSCYMAMFSGCTSLTTVPELPATTLAESCYYQMFNGCTSLTTAPELPATTLAAGCYSNMFLRCTSLTTAPELPATTLDGYCYEWMFSGCTSLTTAPELPATTLAILCYRDMFSRCTSLTTAPELPATTLVQYCYKDMFSECTSLNYLKMNALENVNEKNVGGMLRDVSPTGTLVIPSAATYSDEDLRAWTGMPSGWTIVRQ